MDKTLVPSDTVTVRDPKGREFVSTVTDPYDKAGLSQKEARRVNNTPGLADLIADFIARNRCGNKFKDEEVTSLWGYHSGYEQPTEVTAQIDILRGYWPRLDPDPVIHFMRDVHPTLQLPDWVEGPFVTIRPSFFSDNYGEELEEVLRALAKSLDGAFHNYQKGKLGPEHLRQSERTLAALRTLMERQPEGNLLVSYGQFGARHGYPIARSVRRAQKVFITDEYGSGAKDVGTMLLTHPNRLRHYTDQRVDCAGDEYRPDADGDFNGAPFYCFGVDQVKFGARDVGKASSKYGSASAFLAQ